MARSAELNKELLISTGFNISSQVFWGRTSGARVQDVWFAKKKIYHGLHKTAPQSTRQQSTQISQRWSQKFSSSSVLSICKRTCFFCLVLQFIQVITCGEKNIWTCNTVWPIPKKKQLTTTITKKQKNYSNNNNRVNWTKTSETSLLNAVHCCCLFSLQPLLGKSPLK